MEDEMNQRFAEIDYDKFMQDLVPGCDPSAEDLKRTKFSKLTKLTFSGVESTMHPVLCNAIQPVLSGSGLVVKDTGDQPQSKEERRRADLTIYNAKALAARNKMNGVVLSTGKSKIQAERRKHLARMSWPDAIVPIELKRDAAADPFNDEEGKPLLSVTHKGKLSRGQMIEYVGEMFLQQHRVYVFSVFIVRERARLLRWDRVGVTVSESFDIKDQPHKLLNFFWRVGKMNLSELGYDPTVVPATAVDIREMTSYIPHTTGHVREYVSEAMEGGVTVYDVQVPEDGLDTPRHFLIGKPRNDPRSVCGRGTRGYIAFDMQDKQFVFLKDSWRLCSRSAHPEYEVYKHLMDTQQHKPVRYIATMICGGDVDSQLTKAQEYIQKPYSPRAHYRIVIRQIGRPLKDYENLQELCGFVLFALVAHQDAWEQAKVLHRDISDGNILIDDDPDGEEADEHGKKTPQGLLIDWDLCRYEEDLERGASEETRSGTWRFLSGLVLTNPTKRYKVSDDIESFIHLVNWFALRYHQHDMSSKPGDLASHLYTVYEQAEINAHGHYVGSNWKMKLAAKGDPGFILSSVNQFSVLINRLMELCRTHYKTGRQMDGKKSEKTSRLKLPSSMPILEEEQKEPGQIASTGTDSNGKPVLDTHRAIIQLFLAAAASDDWPASDKQSDQFAGLLNICLASGRSTFVAMSSDKRTSADADLDPPEQMAKRQKGSANSSSTDPEISGQLDVVDEEVEEVEEDELEEEEGETDSQSEAAE